jgi:hypothetical protein
MVVLELDSRNRGSRRNSRNSRSRRYHSRRLQKLDASRVFSF